MSYLTPLLLGASMAHAQAMDDPYQWLEDVTGDRPLAWVKERNAKSQAQLEAKPEFKQIHERLLSIYNSRERIPGVQKRGRWLYNFWQDAQSPRGIWRRTTLDEYRKKDPAWETVLDIGKVGAVESVNWVWKGASCLYPDYERCLVELSRGGADAVEVREFDIARKEFVKGGFVIPEAKTDYAWRDRDTIYVATDFGPGSMTTSGYPRIMKEWRRGTPLAEAKTVREAQANDVGIDVSVVNERGQRYERVRRAIDFWNGENFVREGDSWVPLDVPRDASVAIANHWLILNLKTAWKAGGATFKGGSLIGVILDKFLAGERDFEAIYEPGERVALQDYAITKDMIVLDLLDNVKSKLVEVRRQDGKWVRSDVPVPPASSIDVSALDRDDSNDYWMTVTSFVEPTTLYLASPGKPTREKLKGLPAFFDSKGLKTTQGEAISRDGTKVPYFVLMRDEAKLDGSNPTILYGYGGYEISMLPAYNGAIGSAWLEKGGVYVLANIRGGGEFGPQWHTTALREGRQKAHDDFIAVAEDVIKRRISSPKHLGIMGGSQGGLLVGAAFTQRPELFKAVVCQVPLLDMRRFNRLLAGASWMGEYGNPDDPADWAFISKYSPYQNVVKDKKYPRVLFTTSTRDDRVHPGHARKMVARMSEQGHDVLYYENTEGGHAAGTTPAQQAYMWALTYTFFLSELR